MDLWVGNLPFQTQMVHLHLLFRHAKWNTFFTDYCNYTFFLTDLIHLEMMQWLFYLKQNICALLLI